MSSRANVASIEAIEAFRANLVVFNSKARRALEEIGDEVVQTRVWLQSDRQAHWDSQVRRWTKEVERAREAMFSASMSALRTSTSSEEMAMARARRNLDEAQNRLRMVKQWNREFDTRVEPLARQLDHLRNFLTQEMPKAAALLAQTVKALDAYADVALPADAGVTTGAADPAAAGEGGGGGASGAGGDVGGTAP